MITKLKQGPRMQSKLKSVPAFCYPANTGRGARRESPGKEQLKNQHDEKEAAKMGKIGPRPMTGVVIDDIKSQNDGTVGGKVTLLSIPMNYYFAHTSSIQRLSLQKRDIPL